MAKKKDKKQKKEKIVYIDDGSTVADMSGLRQKTVEPPPNSGNDRSRPRWLQILGTYFDSVKLMLLPTLAFVGILALAFLLVWLLMNLSLFFGA